MSKHGTPFRCTHARSQGLNQSLIPKTTEPYYSAPELVRAVNGLCQGYNYGTLKSAVHLLKQREVDIHKHPSRKGPDGSSLEEKAVSGHHR